MRPAEHLLVKLESKVLELRAQLQITPRNLQEILAPLVRLGRLHMRPIQFWLAARWDDSLSRIDLPLLVDTELRDALIVWSETGWILQGLQLLSLIPDLFTDSSQGSYRS